MGEHANFYNSKNGDRKYDADSLTEWLKPFFTTGVFNGELEVLSNQDMTVSVKPGNVNIGGKHKYFENTTILTIEAPHATLRRIDNIVVRRDDVARDIIVYVQKGQFSATPIAPIPVREGAIFELVLAQVNVSSSVVKILPSDIRDTRMIAELCGWVVSTVEEIDFTQITKQWENYMSMFKIENQDSFNAWFERMKDQLSTDAAGNLQSQIDKNKKDFDDILITKLDNPKQVTTTLMANGWIGTSVPYTYTFTDIIEIQSINTIIELMYIDQGDTTDANYKIYIDMLGEADIKPVDELQDVGKFILRAWGVKPTINLPIKLLIGGEVNAN